MLNVRTPDLKRPGASSLLLVRPIAAATAGRDLPLRAGGSALLQVFGRVGGLGGAAAVPDCEAPALLVALFEATQTLLDVEGALLSVHDVSDGGVLVAALEMAFAGNCGLELNLPGSSEAPLPALFAEEVGLVLEVAAGREAEVLAAYTKRGVFATGIGRSVAAPDVTVTVGDSVEASHVLAADMRDLRDAWEATSFELEKRQCSAACVAMEQWGLRSRRSPPLHVSFRPLTPKEALIMREPSSKPRVAVLREEGSNGDRELAAAWFSAGFDVFDICMSDLIEGRAAIDSSFRGIAWPGGFSECDAVAELWRATQGSHAGFHRIAPSSGYADVLDSAKGWAGTVRYNELVLSQLKAFYARGDTFSLGVWWVAESDASWSRCC